VAGIFSGVVGAITNLVLVLFVGLYLAFAPRLYVDGFVRLLPAGSRGRVHDVLEVLGRVLRRWLLGRLSVMAVNGTLTALGLWFLGIPLPAMLGLLTGLLNFIPNLGPLLAAVPAVLLALLQGPQEVLWVVVLYLIIQNLDGFVFTPLVQQRTVSLPLVIIITAQVLFGLLLGSLGLLFATPLAAVILVLVKMLYLQDVLSESITIPGEPGA
jgi:predicted PurR-regulated permease PerM